MKKPLLRRGLFECKVLVVGNRWSVVGSRGAFTCFLAWHDFQYWLGNWKSPVPYLIFLRIPHFFQIGIGGFKEILLANTIFIQKEIFNSYISDSVFISPRLDVVPDDYDFLEGVGDTEQRCDFLLFLFGRVNGKR